MQLLTNVDEAEILLWQNLVPALLLSHKVIYYDLQVALILAHICT